MTDTVLLGKRGADEFDIPTTFRGRWCLVSVAGEGCPEPVLLNVVRQSDRPWSCRLLGASASECEFLSRAIMFLPDDSETIRLRAISGGLPLRLRLRRLPRMHALGLILWQRPNVLGRAVKGLLQGQFSGWSQRLRADASVAAEIAYHPRSYARWVEQFDRWGSTRKHALMNSPRRARWPRIDAIVFTDEPASAAAEATRDSLRDQWWPVRQILSSRQMCAATADYVVVLQAGEVLPPHAVALLADEAALDRPPLLLADEDALDRHGHRRDPFFKPQPNHALMLSGTLARGAWLIRRDLLPEAPSVTGGAEGFRLDLWLSLWRRDRTRGRRVPFVLTHRRQDAEAAKPADLAAIVERHAAAADLALGVRAARPLIVYPKLPPEPRQRVAIVIASRCRDPVSLACIRAILRRTSYKPLEIVLVLAQPAPPDAGQREFIAALGHDERLRVVHVPMAPFNYATANNAGVRETSAPLVLFLNDDVAPRRSDWLAAMVAHMRDERVGIVGVKLLYPDQTVQHGGVIMGLGGVAEHGGRLMARDRPGPAGILLLDREASAVTGACMLTRRCVFDALGGLDESFATAFNDVDYCLRARGAGWSVVLSARSPLIHHESLSFGSHYGAADALNNEADEERMRARWSAWIRDDPFHSPNLALFRIADTEPAFPPRTVRFAEPPGVSDQATPRFTDRAVDRALQPVEVGTGAVA